MSDGFNWLITVTVSNNWESLQLAHAFIQLLLLDFKSVPFHRWLWCLQELSIQLIASNNKRNNGIPPFTRVVASIIIIQGVQDKEKRKLTDFQGESQPSVALFPDSTFVVFWEFANSKITPEGRHPTSGPSFVMFLWQPSPGGAISQEFVQPQCEKLLHCSFETQVSSWMLFPATNSKGGFLGISKSNQLLKNDRGFRDEKLYGKGYLHTPWTTWV